MYEIEPYFLQFFQSNTTVCLIIHVFCKSCEPEIVLKIKTVIKIKTKTIHKSYKTRKSTLLSRVPLSIGNFEENTNLSRSHSFCCTYFQIISKVTEVCQFLVLKTKKKGGLKLTFVHHMNYL